MAILPWGLVDVQGAYVWPNEYSPGIAIVNSLIQQFALTQSSVHYVDCGHVLYPTGQVSHMICPSWCVDVATTAAIQGGVHCTLYMCKLQACTQSYMHVSLHCVSWTTLCWSVMPVDLVCRCVQVEE